MTMTVPSDLDAELADLRAVKCTGKACLTAKVARQIAATSRTPEQDPDIGPLEAYTCPFADEHEIPVLAWHVGHAMSIEGMLRTARILRARSGNAPTPRRPR